MRVLCVRPMFALSVNIVFLLLRDSQGRKKWMGADCRSTWLANQGRDKRDDQVFGSTSHKVTQYMLVFGATWCETGKRTR